MSKYLIQYYYDNKKYHYYDDFKLEINKELELLNVIEIKYKIKIERVFTEISLFEHTEEFERYYLKKIVLASNNSKVKVAKVFRTNSGRYIIDNFVLIYRDDIPIAIFPHIINDTQVNVIQGLTDILENGFEKRFDTDEIIKSTNTYIFTETDLQKLIATYPTLIEDGVKLVGVEIPVKDGIIDLVLIDENDQYIVCELKLKFTDQVIGQIIRYSNTFIDEYNVSDVRKAIITMEESDERIKACKKAGIEIYVIKLNKF
ncbi:MAG: endonuclease NucS domain-containing protein [Candidatus Helarchaeota archaeon]